MRSMRDADITKGAITISKYGNRKTEVNGLLFDSRHEANRWIELTYLERAKMIRDLQRQVPFELIPKQTDEKGRVKERAVKYVADFVYSDRNGNLVVEDAKGMRTDSYKLKKKMMRYFKGIEIIEV